MMHSADTWWQGRWWDLPPLILHPFDRGLDAAASLDSIKLSLDLNGMGEPGLEREPLLRGRYTEFRMLSLVGKDVMRWIEQCVDFASRDELLANAAIRGQSFADLLVNRTPPAVAARFESWSVLDYRRILARGIGVNAVFPNPPDFGVISAHFLEEYYAYADALFACYRGLTPFARLEPAAFGFALYTSDEYMTKLAYGLEEAQE
ncbi:MAG: hypothetical protein ABSC93_20920 [Bryobacteraceae bacterium]|jgi:hypothetical protein